MRGRFAPSPTGELHVGNLRTALLAWLSATAAGDEMLVRVEDLDPVTASREHEDRQLLDLAAIGIAPAGEVVHQSERFDRYRAAIARLDTDGLVYPCFCTRREIRDASAAPHGDGLPDGAYPGTCRELTVAERLRHERQGRRAALRLRTAGERHGFDDRIAGRYEGVVDDVVLQRNDGTPAYNLAVVVDDDAQSVEEVVRGDDLLASTPRQIHLQLLLGLRTPAYVHVPLAVGHDGVRLAKRHGAITLDDWTRAGRSVGALVARLASGIGVEVPGSVAADDVRAADLVGGFAWDRVPRTPWRWSDDQPSATMPG